MYPFRVGSPGDSYYFAARFNDENDSFIDMRLEGNANGWIAVGFTETRNMVYKDSLHPALLHVTQLHNEGLIIS